MHRIGQALLRPMCLFSLAALLCLSVSCKKSPNEIRESNRQSPLYSSGLSSGPSSVSLAYDVVIHRTVSFQNGLTAASPGWKKLEAVPETESYSFHAEVSTGDYYLLQDNILIKSLMADHIPLEEKITKVEVINGVSTAYGHQGNIIRSTPVGDLSADFLESVAGLANPAPVNVGMLNIPGAAYKANGNTLTIVCSIANGSSTNSSTLLNMDTGLPLLMTSYDENDPSRLSMVASHTYDSMGKPQTSVFTYYDYLKDGDVKKRTEHWAYSNYSLNVH